MPCVVDVRASHSQLRVKRREAEAEVNVKIFPKQQSRVECSICLKKCEKTRVGRARRLMVAGEEGRGGGVNLKDAWSTRKKIFAEAGSIKVGSNVRNEIWRKATVIRTHGIKIVLQMCALTGS